MKKPIKTLRGPNGIALVLDHNDSDTPALVYCPRRRDTASYSCATGEGELSGGSYVLNEAQLDWLNSPAQEAAVEAACSAARAGHPEYN